MRPIWSNFKQKGAFKRIWVYFRPDVKIFERQVTDVKKANLFTLESYYGHLYVFFFYVISLRKALFAFILSWEETAKRCLRKIVPS